MKIRLSVMSGGIEGARIRVKSSPFVIGREEGSDLVLNSRSISRRHCVLIHQGKRLMVQDLGSRNHTIVGDQVLKEGQACRLWHHDELQVGKVRFRISLRDKESNEPIREQAGQSGIVQLSSILKTKTKDKSLKNEVAAPTNDVESNESPEDLLNELDKLINAKEPVEVLTLTSLERDLAKVVNDVEQGANATEDTTDTHPGPSKEEPVTHHGIQLERETLDASDMAETIEEPPTGPKKLPEHLRPKGPADSQDAATEALRRMFSGRR